MDLARQNDMTDCITILDEWKVLRQLVRYEPLTP